MLPTVPHAVKRRDNPVTAIIGFIAQDSLVVATDSQVTTNDGKKTETTKLFKVDFLGHRALVAIAGYIDGAELFLEIFHESASKAEVKHWRSMADVACDSMKEARRKILEAYSIADITPEKRVEKLSGYFCIVILAYSFGGKPYLFTLDLTSTLAFLSTKPFEAHGSGNSIAAHTLKGFDLGALPFKRAFGIAAYAIEAAKRSDLACSGKTQVGFISIADNKGGVLTGEMENMEKAAAEVHVAIQKELAAQIEQKYNAMKMPIENWD